MKKIALFFVVVGCLVGLTALVLTMSSDGTFGSAKLSLGGPGRLVARAAEKPEAEKELDRPGAAREALPKPAHGMRKVQRSSNSARSSARFELSYPVFSGEGAEALNAGVSKKLCAMLENETSPEAAADGFVKQHAAFVAEFPGSASSWRFAATVTCEGSVANLVCLKMSHHGYAGGAHGFQGSAYVLFDSSTGEEVEWQDTVSPDMMRELTETAEKYFRAGRGLSANEDLNDAGYWFEKGFTLDEAEVGLTSVGLIVHFNPYTIASYAQGSTTYTIPMEELLGVIGVQYALAGELGDAF